jgi:hypothetical protein
MPDLYAIYMAPDGPIEIGPNTADADLDRALSYMRGDTSAQGFALMLQMRVAIENAKAARAEKAFMFKSRRKVV